MSAQGGWAEALLVTTSERPHLAQVERARALAERFGARLWSRRRSLRQAMQERQARLAYVVSRQREELRGLEGPPLFVHQGLLEPKLDAGRAHPLVRAICGDPGDTWAPMRMVDATLGRAGDALHLAAVLGCEVVGVEASPVLYALLEDGLDRMRTERGPLADAAARIALRPGLAAEVLAAMPAASAEVVYLDPMFDAPQAAGPGFDLLREVALEGKADEALLAAASRVASVRVVMKVAPAAPPAAQPPGGWTGRVRGKSVDYVVAQR